MKKEAKETKRLYQENVNIEVFPAKIVDIFIHKVQGICISLDKTAFFPEGGGQPSDQGLISSIAIDYVFEEDDIICHRVAGQGKDEEYDLGDQWNEDDVAKLITDLPFSIGEEVMCQVDWKRRFTNMQRHCGEHILSGAFHTLYNATNRGFHMGDGYMTIDLSLEAEECTLSEISMEHALCAEALANEIIWEDLPVSVRYFDSASEANKYPHRKDLTLKEDISLVCVGDWNNPADLVACCGTHPTSSGQVGLVKVYKVEKNKKLYRVYFDAGRMAMKRYDEYADIVTKLANVHSTAPATLLDRIAKEKERNIEMNEEVKRLQDHVASHLSKDILDRIEKEKALQGTATPTTVITASGLNTEDFQRAAKKLQGKIPGLLVGNFPAAKAVFLYSSGEPDCNLLIKEKGSRFGAKGGGGRSFANAVFDGQEELAAFIESISK